MVVAVVAGGAGREGGPEMPDGLVSGKEERKSRSTIEEFEL